MRFAGLCLILLVSPLLLAAGEATPGASSALPVGPDRKVTRYRLESVEVRGTGRMSAEQLSDELGLANGILLDDELVMNARSKLLGLGLFKSAILVMRKGQTPGMAKLIVEVEDDEGVLGDSAMGGELGVTLTDRSASSIETDSAPMDYKVGLIARNFMNSLHRSAATIDFDAKGNIRAGQFAYGLPRFAREDVQFDAEIAATAVRYRYLDALGFGGRGQGLWSRTLDNGLGEWQYGAAMYTNRKASDFQVPGFPAAVVGPKLAFRRESRLIGFFPGEGSLLAVSLLFAPTRSDLSVLELNIARTLALGSFAYWTFDGKGLSAGVRDYAVRAESRLDFPLGRARGDEDQAEIFLRLRGGYDYAQYEASEKRHANDTANSEQQVALLGSAAIIGVRYHSSGFIAELSLKVTRSPEQLRPKTIGPGDLQGNSSRRDIP